MGWDNYYDIKDSEKRILASIQTLSEKIDKLSYRLDKLFVSQELTIHRIEGKPYPCSKCGCITMIPAFMGTDYTCADCGWNTEGYHTEEYKNKYRAKDIHEQ